MSIQNHLSCELGTCFCSDCVYFGVECVISCEVKQLKSEKHARDIASNVVRELYESRIIDVPDCWAEHFGEKHVDWVKFYADGAVKEAMAIVYLAVRGCSEGGET